MSDRQLRDQLARRVGSAPLDSADRVELIESIHDHVSGSRQAATGWRAWRWLPAAAMLTALVLVAVLAYPRATTTPPASRSPSASPAAGPVVLSPQQLAEAVAARNSIGLVVLADARLGEDLRPDFCEFRDPCFRRYVSDTQPPLMVNFAEFFEFEAPADDTVLAFRIEDGFVTLLGQTLLAAKDGSWTVDELVARAPTEADPTLYAVDGWLVESPSPVCRARPPNARGLRDKHGCEVSWVTGSRTYAVTPASSALPNIPVILRGLLVQGGSYRTFADDPTFGDRGAEPRHGIYLVRPDSCPTWQCPAWEIVGRVSAAANTLPTTSPAP